LLGLLGNLQDSSAIHVIPRVRVVRHHHDALEDKNNTSSSSSSRKHVFLIKVANPTLGTVRLRITESKYSGEVDYWNELDNNARTTPSFTNLLVDTLTHTVVQAELKPGVARTIGTTETVELLSAEDSIIEMGGKARATPEQVLNWNPATVVENVDNGTTAAAPGSLRLVAQSASDAWFELVLREEDPPSSTLEVHLGNGSWESSLIPVKEGLENDKVQFDLVLVWT
jgi:hypothetical protein